MARKKKETLVEVDAVVDVIDEQVESAVVEQEEAPVVIDETPAKRPTLTETIGTYQVGL